MLQKRKGSFHDLNALFVFGALSVLMIHILGFFIEARDVYPGNYNGEALSIILLRFGRSIFVFATGMLLFYWYKHREVDWLNFWQKRWNRIIVPYLIWTAIYTYFQFQTFDPSVLLPAYARSLFTGSSFYHLYYIPLYLQLNLLFFISKRFIERFVNIRTVGAVLLLQIGIYLLFHFLFEDPVISGIDWNGSIGLSLIHQAYVSGQTYLYMYLFYFILGAFAGIYIDIWRDWLKRLQYVSLAVLMLSTLLIVRNFLGGFSSYSESLNIFSPLYLLYTTSFIASCYPISSYLGKLESLREPLAKLAKHNMAIYMVHPLILFLLESYVIFRLDWSTAVYVLVMFVVTPPLCIFLYEHVSLPFWKRNRPKPKKQPRPVIHTHQA